MPTSFQNLIAKLFWPRISPPLFTVESQDVYQLDRPSYVQVNVTARLEGQIPADQCAWLVEFVGPSGDGRPHFIYHPKRPLEFAFPWQRYVSESYLSSGSAAIERRPGVLIVPRSMEAVFWQTLEAGRQTGNYQPLSWHQPANELPPAIGASYKTA